MAETAAVACVSPLDLEQNLQETCGLLSHLLMARSWKMVSAESCTGGLIAATCTSQEGSSRWFDRGFVTYSNAAKTDMLDVDSRLIASHGAVSEVVACAMAHGALERSAAQMSVVVTGLAGPGGGSSAKPLGTVWFAWATPTEVISQQQHFSGDRTTVRHAAVGHALKEMVTLLQTRCT